MYVGLLLGDMASTIYMSFPLSEKNFDMRGGARAIYVGLLLGDKTH